jgi:hypothetical protein
VLLVISCDVLILSDRLLVITDAWFFAWPIRAEGRAVLTELSDPELIAEKDKHYFLRRRRIDEPEPDRNDFVSP